MNVANRMSSLTYMFFNIRGGLFKNGLKAATDMIIKANGNMLVTKKDLAFGINHYKFQDMLEAISSAFEQDPKNKDMALIRMFDYIFQDWRQGSTLEQESGLDKLSRSFTIANEMGYSPLNIAEHFAQYSMLLAMIHSHKYYRGIILSKGEWKLQVRDRVIKSTDILTQEQKERYNKFVEEQQKRSRRANAAADYTDYFAKFMLVDKTITKDQRKALALAIQEENSKSEEMWNKIPNLYDNLEFKDGKIVPKDSLNIENLDAFTAQMSNFGRRVQAVNQSLHGIYNIQDQMKVADYSLGQLTIQFKKWMRPNFVRYFGRRWNQVGFSEQLMMREVPLYKIFFDTFTTPKLYIRERGVSFKDNKIEYTRLYFEGLLNQLGKINVYYKFLPEEDKAAAREFVAHMATFVISLATTLVVLGSFDDDDDKKRRKKKQSLFLSHLKYLSAATFAEISEPIPIYGWSATFRTFKNRPMAAYSLGENTYLAMYYGILTAFGNHSIYKRGVYKGQNKGYVHLKKSLPLINQIEKMFTIDSATNYYSYISSFL
jgi:hypothetical protein